MTRLYVDDRYHGAHGVGRYAREVLQRLRPELEPLGLDRTPYRPLDAFRSLPSLDRSALVYSPGYGALVRASRHVLTIHDLIQMRTLHRLKFTAYYNGPVRYAVRKAGVVLTVSETSARTIREWMNDDSVRIVNAGTGCSAAFRIAGPTFSADARYLLFVGNMRAHKNFDVVLRALTIARAVHLRAVLPEREVPEAEARAHELGVTDRLHLTSGVGDKQLAALYRGAAATILPSLDEGFGLPALESISCGTPVAFWQGCEAVAETVGDRGWAVSSSQDAKEWAAAAERAIATERRVEPPEGLYDWDRTADIVSDILESMLR